MPMTRIIIAALVALVVSGTAGATDDHIRWEEWDVYSCEGEKREYLNGVSSDRFLDFHRLFIKKDGSEAAIAETSVENPLKLQFKFRTTASYILRNDEKTEFLTISKFGTINYKHFAEGSDYSGYIVSRCTKNPPIVFGYDIYEE
jgi:hypothetical protein